MSKLEQIESLVREWIDKQGHDKCWYYPDIFNSICEVLDIKVVNQGLPKRCEFEEGCRRYQNEVYDE